MSESRNGQAEQILHPEYRLLSATCLCILKPSTFWAISLIKLFFGIKLVKDIKIVRRTGNVPRTP
jgi:hypothetical protein